LGQRNSYDEAFKELYKDVDIGSIMITSVLHFDDLFDQFKMERY